MTGKRLSQYKNIGEKSEALLNQVGIYSIEDLDAVGAITAWKRVREIEPSASLVGVYALQGALMNLHWNHLPDEIKADLREQWEAD